MSLSEYLEKESRKELFKISLTQLRRFDTLERLDDGEVVVKTRCTAKGAFGRNFMHDSVKVDVADKEITRLPLAVDLVLADPTAMTRNAAFGFLSFSKALSTDDGIVDEPDSVTLTLLLPESLLSRFTADGPVPGLAIRVDGLEVRKSGAMPGLSEKVWRTAEKGHLLVTECTILDEMPDEDEAEVAGTSLASDGSVTADEQTVTAPFVRLDSVFERRLFLWLGAIAGLLFVIMLK